MFNKFKLLLLREPLYIFMLQLVYFIVFQCVVIGYSNSILVTTYDSGIVPPCCLISIEDDFEYPVYEVTLVIDSDDRVRQIESTMIRQPYYPIYVPEIDTNSQDFISDSGSTTSETAISEYSSDTSSNASNFQEVISNNFRLLLEGLSPTEKAKAINADFFQQIAASIGQRKSVPYWELADLVYDILSTLTLKIFGVNLKV